MNDSGSRFEVATLPRGRRLAAAATMFDDLVLVIHRRNIAGPESNRNGITSNALKNILMYKFLRI